MSEERPKCPDCGESREGRFIPDFFCDSCGWYLGKEKESK